MDTKDLKGLMEAYSEVYALEQLEEMEVKLKTPEERAKYIEDAKKREERKKQPSIFDYARKRKEEGRPLKINLSRAVAAQNKKEAEKRAALKKEELDIFDVVLEFLQAEGYAETLEEAEWLMANVINEEAIGIILGEDAGIISGLAGLALGAKGATYAAKHTKRLRDYPKNFVKGMVDPRTYGSKKKKEQNEEYVDEAQAARENPEKYEREQAKKSAPVRGERTPMPPRGDKRREDFEKWYAANVR